MWSTSMQMLGQTKTHHDYPWLGYHTLFSLLVYQSSIWRLWVVSFVNHTWPWLNSSSAVAAAWYSQFMSHSVWPPLQGALCLPSLPRCHWSNKSLRSWIWHLFFILMLKYAHICRNFGCSSYHSANGRHLETVMERWAFSLTPVFRMPASSTRKCCQFRSVSRFFVHPAFPIATIAFELKMVEACWDWCETLASNQTRHRTTLPSMHPRTGCSDRSLESDLPCCGICGPARTAGHLPCICYMQWLWMRFHQ